MDRQKTICRHGWSVVNTHLHLHFYAYRTGEALLLRYYCTVLPVLHGKYQEISVLDVKK